MAQQQRTPDLNEQRAAMRKLSFLVGRWAGEARLLRGPDRWVTLAQTEEAQYKLDGLVLVIEGVGRAANESAPVLQALGIISYDDAHGAYRMRAFNGGRFLESEVKLLDGAGGISWGFSFGEIRTSTTLRINDAGDWTESAVIAFGASPSRTLMELKVSRQK